MTSPLSDGAKDELDKHLAHMTKPGAALRMKNWDMEEFVHPIYLRAFEFCAHLVQNFLDPKMDAQMVGQLRSFQKGLLSHIKRSRPLAIHER